MILSIGEGTGLDDGAPIGAIGERLRLSWVVIPLGIRFGEVARS